MSTFVYNQDGVGVTNDQDPNYYFTVLADQNNLFWCKIIADQSGLLQQIGWKMLLLNVPQYNYYFFYYIGINLYSLSDDESTQTLIGTGSGSNSTDAGWYPVLHSIPMQDVNNQAQAPHITAGQKYKIEFTMQRPQLLAQYSPAVLMFMQYYDYSSDPAFQDHKTVPSTYRYRCNIMDIGAGYNSNINNGAFPYLQFVIYRDGSAPGGWSDWSPWSACDVPCSTGNQTRTRTCTNPAPLLDGVCTGPDTDTQSCDTGIPCPIDGGWSDWSAWSDCTVGCGGGTQTQTRTCTNPAPQYGGQSCQGPSSQTQTCNTNPCPVDGGWTDWQWTDCSSSCAGGVQVGTRECTNPKPQYGGQLCVGDYMQTQTCNTGACPIDGGWTDWGPWSNCSASCGGGVQTATRTCSNPVSRNGGADCQGPDTITAPCNTQACSGTSRFVGSPSDDNDGSVAVLWIMILIMIIAVAVFISMGYDIQESGLIMPIST